MPSRYLMLANCGVSTSGDAMQYVVKNGKRYSHIIAPSAMTADALATTLTVLGIDRGIDSPNGKRTSRR